jgi:dihydropteroate synthase
MGVVNATPDSFYGGSRASGAEEAAGRALRAAREGADVVDVGGESTRPGADPVAPAAERERVVPVIREIRERDDSVAISVDTRRASVAAAALDAGADMVNDVSALSGDPEMAALVAERGVPVVLMHMRGEPRTMQRDPRYGDVLAEVTAELEGAAERAVSAGVPRERILVDPGIGFGKTVEHNLALLRGVPSLLGLGLPVVVGPSRKSFLGAILDLPDPADRLNGTLAVVAHLGREGAHVVRVHDVSPAREVLRVVEALGASPRATA